MPQWFDKLKTNLGLNEDGEAQQEQTLLQQMNEATTLDRTQRAIGFLTCVGIGLLLSFMAPMFIFRPTKFAMIYSLGNVLSITMFLMGPATQMARMFDSRRWISTAVYLTSLVLTMVSALVFHSVLLCIVFIVIQFCALVWYALSYIPYGQATLMRLLGRETAETG
ncbi:hypothetical protein CHLNCDRAFT_144275 [Chlorella variabilis]|uniref:Vesicle transport protein n=1 Tax=Chlorella variabilis TaxID=554065 RepID=E1ZCB7_CHLVA|nr:hypothetical protein CHLNCDRAFT_144275 [Chlorella variabilis]EFN56579.1 hypothetical protein CHLNCDRAFT_144275 [Chlorella variabilis]|eukprot:XP_005848681.1 hypothetical protein CHLNCDRAFT_144275 [Chlorella variabilis]